MQVATVRLMSAPSRGRGKGDFGEGRLGSLWERMDSSFWFLPALMTAGGIALFFFTQHLDQIVRTDLASLPVIFSGGATAARSVLSAISGSLITVVATVFSLTIVALQLASSQYSPRLLRSFTSDRGVQLVLGAYIATFVYSLLVLRIIRTAESEGASFNPVISVTIAVVLALVCVGFLIYFIQHIADLIQSSTIVQRAHKDTVETIDNLADLDGPSAETEEPEKRLALDWLPTDTPSVARARESGYVQYLNVDTVVEAVAGEGRSRKASVVEVPFGPGHFVAAGLPIVRVWPADAMGPDAKSEEGIHEGFYFGKERSFRQDFAFGLRQLSDIALKGLSPGVNDPTTAMQAMDRVEAIFVALGKKAMPRRVQEREINGAKVLVKVGYYGFDDVVGLAFDQIRRAAFTSGQVAVLERLLEVIDRAVQENPLPDRRRSLWARAFTVARLAPGHISDPEDGVNLVRGAVRVGAHLLETDLRTEVASDLEELADLSDGLRGGSRIREAVETALD